MRRGFTLVEILVVIGILAVLAAILFPVFASAREKARQANCTSNLKQLVLALKMYESDWLRLPQPRDWAGTSITSKRNESGGIVESVTRYDPVNGSLAPYAKNTQIYICPSDSRETNLSYGLIQTARRYGTDSFKASERALVAEAESDVFAKGLTYRHAGTPYKVDPTGVIETDPGGNNSGLAGVGFADGHVKFLGEDTVLAAKSRDFIGY